MPCIYILFSKSKKQYYTGSSREDNSSSRLIRHNGSQVRSTKSGVPWNLLHEEYFSDYTEARKRENFLKSGVGRQWVRSNFPQEILQK